MWPVTTVLDDTDVRYKYFHFSHFTCKDTVDQRDKIIFSKVTELVNEI